MPPALAHLPRVLAAVHELTSMSVCVHRDACTRRLGAWSWSGSIIAGQDSACVHAHSGQPPHSTLQEHILAPPIEALNASIVATYVPVQTEAARVKSTLRSLTLALVKLSYARAWAWAFTVMLDDLLFLPPSTMPSLPLLPEHSPHCNLVRGAGDDDGTARYAARCSKAPHVCPDSRAERMRSGCAHAGTSRCHACASLCTETVLRVAL